MNKKEDEERLKKIGVSNLLDLALFAPLKYENLYISKSTKIGLQNVIDATIISTDFNPRFMKLTLFAHNFDKEISGIIFHPRKYHLESFKPKSRFYIFGKLDINYEKLQITQPLIIENINTIIPKYKSKLQNKTMLRIIKESITKDALLESGLDELKVKTLLDVHFPTQSFVENFLKNDGFSDEIIRDFKYLEIYNHLKKLSSKKTTAPSKHKLKGDLKPFLDSLPFELTKDQKKVISEIKGDFNSGTASKRVVMGDVGSGKTMVILAATMLAYPKKTILMAPTTILATQIYEEALKYLPDFFKIALITNKSSKKESLSEYDFLIGTHALLYRDLIDADLVMIDEQHRFGTKQRALISKLVSKDEKQPHFLQFSATPIPRTLSMIQSTIIDISRIVELPFPKDIDTRVIGVSEFSDLVEHIKNEIKLKRQIIVVYPLVEESDVIDYQSIEEARGWWEKNFEKVYVTFGKDKDKESVITEFKNGGNILIATTLIEVGISLPNLSTIVIVAPERLGLATLHQLRGRVSRTGLKGYCYLFSKQKPTKRLIEFSKTLDGFLIAELDLKYRQGGDLLSGDVQSGKSFVWFDPREDEDVLLEVKNKISS